MFDRLRLAMAFQSPAAALLRTLEPGQKIVYHDIGARGDIDYPWGAIPSDRLRVVGFEPDPLEAEGLEARYPNRVYNRYALWSGAERRLLYINRDASTSSLYPENHIGNSVYATPQEGRILDHTVEVDCRSFDSLILSERDIPDFIKIDTQGGELEILRGARRVLTEYAPVIGAETWCAEVYEGAPLGHEVVGFMWEIGYQIFESSVAAAWTHRAPVTRIRQKMIGFNYLFVKKLELMAALAPEKLAPFCYLMELYGYRDYAYAVLERHPTVSQARRSRLMRILAENDAAEGWMPGRIARKALRAFGKGYRRYPDIT